MRPTASELHQRWYPGVIRKYSIGGLSVVDLRNGQGNTTRTTQLDSGQQLAVKTQVETEDVSK